MKKILYSLFLLCILMVVPSFTSKADDTHTVELDIEVNNGNTRYAYFFDYLAYWGMTEDGILELTTDEYLLFYTNLTDLDIKNLSDTEYAEMENIYYNIRYTDLSELSDDYYTNALLIEYPTAENINYTTVVFKTNLTGMPYWLGTHDTVFYVLNCAFVVIFFLVIVYITLRLSMEVDARRYKKCKK